jgi:hypothetical protein
MDNYETIDKTNFIKQIKNVFQQINFQDFEAQEKHLIKDSDVINVEIFCFYLLTCRAFGMISANEEKHKSTSLRQLVKNFSGIKFARTVYVMSEELDKIIPANSNKKWPSTDQMAEIERKNKEFWKGKSTVK